MTTKELQTAINNGSCVTYNGKKYKAIGYQLLMKNGKKIRSAILADIKTSNSWIQVELHKIGGIEE